LTYNTKATSHRNGEKKEKGGGGGEAGAVAFSWFESWLKRLPKTKTRR